MRWSVTSLMTILSGPMLSTVCFAIAALPARTSLFRSSCYANLVWVLDRVHGQTKPQIVEVLGRLLGLDLLHFEQESVVRQSLIRFRAGKASFPDYVIGEISRQAGCRDTVSFDRDLRRAPGFTVLG
jgi:predicted nucleic-acid-binding protein